MMLVLFRVIYIYYPFSPPLSLSVVSFSPSLLPFSPTLLRSYSPILHLPPTPVEPRAVVGTQAGTVFYMWSHAYLPILSLLMTFSHSSPLS